MNRPGHTYPTPCTYAARNDHVGVGPSPSPHRDAPRGTSVYLRYVPAGASHSAAHILFAPVRHASEARRRARVAEAGMPPRLANTEVPLAGGTGASEAAHAGGQWLARNYPSTSTPGHRRTWQQNRKDVYICTSSKALFTAPVLLRGKKSLQAESTVYTPASLLKYSFFFVTGPFEDIIEALVLLTRFFFVIIWRH